MWGLKFELPCVCNIPEDEVQKVSAYNYSIFKCVNVCMFTKKYKCTE